MIQLETMGGQYLKDKRFRKEQNSSIMNEWLKKGTVDSSDIGEITKEDWQTSENAIVPKP